MKRKTATTKNLFYASKREKENPKKHAVVLKVNVLVRVKKTNEQKKKEKWRFLVDTINYEEAWIEQHQSGDNQSHCIGVI
jgi:hypothetical protein